MVGTGTSINSMDFRVWVSEIKRALSICSDRDEGTICSNYWSSTNHFRYNRTSSPAWSPRELYQSRKSRMASFFSSFQELPGCNSLDISRPILGIRESMVPVLGIGSFRYRMVSGRDQIPGFIWQTGCCWPDLTEVCQAFWINFFVLHTIEQLQKPIGVPRIF